MKFKIGEGSSVRLSCHFTGVTEFEMGNNSTINQYCRIDNRSGVYNGDNVSISPGVDLITADHDVYTDNCAGRQKAIYIKDFVFRFKCNGTTWANMETGSVLGAKSLLTKSTSAYGIYIGTPAKHVAKRPHDLSYNASYQMVSLSHVEDTILFHCFYCKKLNDRSIYWNSYLREA